jgi:hypothetical protein
MIAARRVERPTGPATFATGAGRLTHPVVATVATGREAGPTA